MCEGHENCTEELLRRSYLWLGLKMCEGYEEDYAVELLER